MDPETLDDLIAALDRNTAAHEQGAATSRALLTVLCESETEAAKRIRAAKAEARELAKAKERSRAELAAKLAARGTTIEAEKAKVREKLAARDARKAKREPKRTLAELTGRGASA